MGSKPPAIIVHETLDVAFRRMRLRLLRGSWIEAIRAKAAFSDREPIVDCSIHAAMNCAKHRSERQRRFGREQIGKRQRLVEEFGSGDNAIDETQARRFCGIEGASG